MNAEYFLLAAKRCEIASLQHLVVYCDQVFLISELIHALQRERGLTNLALESGGEAQEQKRREQVEVSLAAEQAFRDGLTRFRSDESSLAVQARLLSHLAHVIHGLDGLPKLRAGAAAHTLDSETATNTFSQVIAELLAVVVEAADVSGDPDMTRELVALFNFMQGKEHAGQERAWGTIGFASGVFSAKLGERLNGLRDSQERAFSLFEDFAQEQPKRAWAELTRSKATNALLQLRGLIEQIKPGETVPNTMGDTWYQVSTERIDLIRELEQTLTQTLQRSCQVKVEQAERELELYQAQLERLASRADDLDPADPRLSPATLNFERLAAGLAEPAAEVSSNHVSEHLNPELSRTVLELIHNQSEHLTRMADELNQAKQALVDRKRIERAKGLLMEHQGLTEEQAYMQLRNSAMNKNMRMVDMAEQLISVVEMFQQK